MSDPRPLDCRFRSQEEGRSYFRSSCRACGRTITTGLGNRCYLERHPPERTYTQAELDAAVRAEREAILALVRKLGFHEDAHTATAEMIEAAIRENAKVESVSAENDARFSEVLGALNGLADRLDMQKELVLQTKGAAERAEDAADAAKDSAANVKWNIFFTAIGIIGILFVTWQLWMQGVEMTTGILSAPPPVEASE